MADCSTNIENLSNESRNAQTTIKQLQDYQKAEKNNKKIYDDLKDSLKGNYLEIKVDGDFEGKMAEALTEEIKSLKAILDNCQKLSNDLIVEISQEIEELQEYANNLNKLIEAGGDK